MKVVTPLADYLIEGAGECFAKWVKAQWRLREIAMRETWWHGGGVAGVVVYHDPEAIR